jgi:N-acetylglutamate synthase-like GNAT family acetyltransferase
MTPKINIREADSNDISLVAGLVGECFQDVAERFSLTLENCPKHPSHCTDEWIEKDLARGATYYILENDVMALGCVAIEKASPDLCYLERLGVLPEARRNGYGRALVDHIISRAKHIGVKQIGIGIIADDTELKHWYLKIGFVEGETKGFDHLPFLVLFMTYAP